MKIFNYIKNMIKVIIWPILFSIGQFLLILIFGFIFNYNELSKLQAANPNIGQNELNEMFNNLVNEYSYKERLAQFISDNTIWVILLTVIIFIPILIKKYKKFKIKKQKNLDIKNIIYLIFLGISLSLCFNFILINIDKIINITNSYNQANISKNLILTIISTSILGPILEEYLFRGVVYNKLKEFNKLKIAIILSSLVFALSHTGVQIIYAFITGMFLTIIYEKTNNLNYSILLHIILNLTTVLLVNNLVNINIYLSLLIILVSLIVILFITKVKIIESK